MSVILNTTVPSSVLKKKHNAIGCHRVREAIAADIIHFAHVKSTDNLADVLTKPLTGEAFHKLVKPCLFKRPGHIEGGTGGEVMHHNFVFCLFCVFQLDVSLFTGDEDQTEPI